MAKKTNTAAKKTNTAGKKTTTAGKIKPKADAADQLKDFMIDGMKDLYWAEKELVKELPKMSKNATSQKLKDAIDGHLKETKTQVTRLEAGFKALKLKPETEKCDAMDGLLKEAKGIMEETEPGAVRDAAIIAAIQKVEHYEIASYGTLATYAKLLKHKDVLKPLLETLKEEKTCDKDLTKLAKSEINLKAK